MTEPATVPLFMPALVTVLLHMEQKKGAPLTEAEVLEIRDMAACIMMEPDDARKMAERRGYKDIDPENAWSDWQVARAQLSKE